MLPQHVILSLITISLLLLSNVVHSQPTDSSSSNNSPARSLDQFNYESTKNYDNYDDFGPKDWGKVQCKDKDTCVRYMSTC